MQKCDFNKVANQTPVTLLQKCWCYSSFWQKYFFQEQNPFLIIFLFCSNSFVFKLKISFIGSHFPNILAQYFNLDQARNTNISLNFSISFLVMMFFTVTDIPFLNRSPCRWEINALKRTSIYGSKTHYKYALLFPFCH